MKVCGFSFVRNAVQFDYPIVEAITSILPVCDRFVVALGDCQDGTRELLKTIRSPKLEILPTVWDDSLREGGRVLAVETDKALSEARKDADWLFYIQGDEVMHEKHLPAISEAMRTFQPDPAVEALLVGYRHFYGSYDYVGDSRRWYRREIRILRNLPGIHSWKDAQGFRRNGEKLKVKLIDAEMYHYGWVKDPAAQQKKQQSFHKFWHDDGWVKEHIGAAESFDYTHIDSLALFEGSHPAVMQPRINRINWKFSHDVRYKNLSLRNRLAMLLEKWTGWRMGEYRNYRML